MLYVFYGTNYKAKNQALKKNIDSQGGEVSFKFTEENFIPESLDELTGGQGLFSPNYIVILENLLKNKEAKEAIFEKIESLNRSKNTFILTEDFLGKKDLETIKGFSKEISEFREIEKEEDKFFQNPNIFSLTEAFGKKDKKGAWITFHKVLPASLPEEIASILFWQVKAIILSQHHKNAVSSGLKPFVFNKSFNFSRNFTPQELNVLSSKIVHLYHEGHRGNLNLTLGLEKFILETF